MIPTRDLIRLPPKLNIPPQKLLILLKSLQFLYSPIIKDKSRTQQLQQESLDSGYNSESEQVLDEFEKNFARSYCMRLVQLGSEWVEEMNADDSEEIGEEQREEQDRRTEVVELAALLVSILSATSESGPIHRQIILPTNSDPIEISLLDDLPGEDATAVGLQSWGASILLARKMALNPSTYGLKETVTPLRILELGAGTGLLSILCGKLLQKDDNLIIATDYHEAVLGNLRLNVEDNDDIDVIVEVLDWFTVHSAIEPILPIFQPGFDRIFGGDVVYRADHSRWLYSTVSKLLLKPSSINPFPTFHLIAPLRPTHTEAIASILEVFPLESELPKLETKEWRLGIKKIEELEREYGVGRVDELGYREYTIGWC